MSKVPLLSVSSVDNSLINNINTNSNTITTAFDNTLSRNGASPNQMQSTLDMNNNPIINIPYATGLTQPVALGQVTPNTTFIPVLSGDVSSGSFNGTTLPTTVNNVHGVAYSANPSTNTVPVVTSSNTITYEAVPGSAVASNTIANTNLSQMAANTIKGNPTGGTANAQDVIPAQARSVNLLNIESVTNVGDTNYQILVTDRCIINFVGGGLTAPRTFTLPLASNCNSGQRFTIISISCTPTNTLTIQRSGSNTIGTASSFSSSITSSTNYWSLDLITDTFNWFVLSESPFSSSVPGQVLASGGGTVNFLRADGNWVQPTVATTPTVQRFTSGTSQTYTPTAGTIYIKVSMVGGGGGGGASSTNVGSNGTTTSFGSWTAVNGSGGGTTGGAGGAGGSGGGTGTGTLINRISGQAGSNSTGAAPDIGGSGASTSFGGGGPIAIGTNPGVSAIANTGSGGGGGSASAGGGGGGGAGEYVEFFVNSPTSTTYTVGTGGAGGVAGGQAGGNGAAGIIIIEEYPF